MSSDTATVPRIALVIGNADYDTSAFGSLDRGPELDASGVADKLTGLGFDVINPESPGRPVLNASLSGMRQALDAFASALNGNKGAIAFFYYSGHGVAARPDVRSSDKTYLVPVDADFEFEHQAQNLAMSLDEVISELTALDVRAGLVILDACRNNAMKSRFRSGTRGLSIPATTQGLLVAYSTAAGAVAENRSERMSVYTESLVKHLGTPGQGIIHTFMGVQRDVAAQIQQEPELRIQLREDVILRAADISRSLLAVTSFPSGAEVFVDEIKVGSTPLTDSTLGAGQTVTVRVVLPGYVPATQRVRMGNGTMPVHVALARNPSGSSVPPVLQNPAQPVKPPEPVSETDPLLRRVIGELVSIPGGSFEMGCLAGDNECRNDEKPAHTVQIRPFRLGKYEVTFDQWDAYAEATGGYRPADEGWGRGNRPVINVSWDDIQGFLKWLNANSSGGYRLPTEAEWEYAARAGTKTKYSWGNTIGRGNANCDGCGSWWGNQKTAPVGSFPPNGFGLFELHGNVYEWTQDCLNLSYEGAPRDSSASLSGDCSNRELRGGSWGSFPAGLRAASRGALVAARRGRSFGFRLAREAS